MIVFDSKTAYSIAYREYKTFNDLNNLKDKRQKTIDTATKEEEAEYKKGLRELKKNQDPTKTKQLNELRTAIAEKRRNIEQSPEIRKIDGTLLELQARHEGLLKARQTVFQPPSIQEISINYAA